MKVYTGTGDKGKTSLFSGERISKSDFRIEAYGEVDELNALLGATLSVLPAACKALAPEIETIQAGLFKIGAWLATRTGSDASVHLAPIVRADHQWLETAIDQIETALPRLNSFIFPGGHTAAALAHIARTVCRRTERHIVRFYDQQHGVELTPESQNLLIYLNRLSDYLFVLARYINHQENVAERCWKSTPTIP